MNPTDEELAAMFAMTETSDEGHEAAFGASPTPAALVDEDLSWVDDPNEVPTVDALFPNWRDLFAHWPYVRQLVHPLTGQPVLLVGYVYKYTADRLRLDNAMVDGTTFASLASLCKAFSKSSNDDDHGLKIAVVRAVEGTRVRVWRSTKAPDGKRAPDEAHATLVVRGGALVRLR